MRRIDLADFGAFTRSVRLGRMFQLAAAVVAIALSVLVFLAAPRATAESDPLLPHSASTIVVLDLSASISWDTFARIATTLDGLRRSNGKVGLIVFSDTAYQLLPPGTPSRELASYERFFVVRQQTQPGFQPQPPASPWTNAFSSGTRISTGLKLALNVIQQDAIKRPRVLLVSDLDDDTTDLESMTSVALAYRKLGVPISVAGLSPSAQDAAYMQRLLPHGGSIVDVPLRANQQAPLPARSPVRLIVFAVLLAVALALLVVSTNRLRWVPA